VSTLPHLTATHVVANDLNSAAIEFYSCLKSPDTRAELISWCDETLSHPKHLELANTQILDECIVKRAWSYWTISWLCRGGSLGTTSEGKGKPSVRRKPTGGSNASRLRSAAGDLDAWAEHFKRCEFTCDDFRKCLDDTADADTNGLYCDPVWPDDGDKYIEQLHGDGDDPVKGHTDLRDRLQRFTQTKVLVRYGEHPLIRELYQESNGWRFVQATSRTQSNAKKPELLIVLNG